MNRKNKKMIIFINVQQAYVRENTVYNVQGGAGNARRLNGGTATGLEASNSVCISV